MDLLIQKLERGKESCNQVIHMFQKLQSSSSPLDHHHHHHESNDDDHQGDNMGYLKGVDDEEGANMRYSKGVDHHLKVVQTTLDDALDVLKSPDFIENVMQMMNKTKARRTDINDSPNHCCKFEDKFGGEIPKHANFSKDRRGCYKRRRNQQERIVETPNLTDDGHAWRKYGQKTILNSTHPRNYYRCTHKYEEGCQATKQVQQISENPPKYKIIYHGQHTCKASTSTNNPTILFNSIDDNNNSILLSFESSAAKHPLNYPFIFPPTTTTTTTPSSSSSSSGVAMLAASSIKQEVIASEPLNEPTHIHQYVAPSPDVTAVSDNVVDELYSSVSSVQGVDADECYSSILADVLINLDDDIYNQPNSPLMMPKLMSIF